jgi:hypothetical protein
MNVLFYTCLVAVPVIAALQRFSVAYGYEGITRAAARRQARNVFVMLAMICAIAGVVHAI